jgi:hypothetical protein
MFPNPEYVGAGAGLETGGGAGEERLKALFMGGCAMELLGAGAADMERSRRSVIPGVGAAGLDGAAGDVKEEKSPKPLDVLG